MPVDLMHINFKYCDFFFMKFLTTRTQLGVCSVSILCPDRSIERNLINMFSFKFIILFGFVLNLYDNQIVLDVSC